MILSLLIVLAVIGVIAYLLTLLPMPQPFRTVIIVVACIFALVIALRALGIWF